MLSGVCCVGVGGWGPGAAGQGRVPAVNGGLALTIAAPLANILAGLYGGGCVAAAGAVDCLQATRLAWAVRCQCCLPTKLRLPAGINDK